MKTAPPTPNSAAVNSPELVAVAFGRVLRGAGIVVPVGRVMSFVEALGLAGVQDRSAVYWSGRATLVSDPEDLGLYDKAFKVFWEHHEVGGLAVEAPPVTVTLATDAPDDEEGDDDSQEAGGPTLKVRWSRIETLRDKDFASCSDAELAELHQLMASLKFTSTTRPSRRLVRSKRHTRRPDLGRTVRRALSTGGEPIRREFSRADRRSRRLVLLLDVSGSMEPYARALIRFAHAAVVGRARVEAFTLGTRLTRVTRELTSRDPDAALRAAGESVADWSGGTRLGDTLRWFNDQWGVRGQARGAVVVVLSDGWDRGEPEQLAEQMERLHRVTYKLVWVNPLKHTPGYAPLARGMAAALPHVDDFIEGHSFDSLERLARVVSA
ncbi:MAG: hypothetical protein ACI91O_000432 [Candidatus Poriferisodalaceae bacterium]|jgi:uncharacterized protein with von Willebrand factor type A (vWA) domain